MKRNSQKKKRWVRDRKRDITMEKKKKKGKTKVTSKKSLSALSKRKKEG